MTHLCAQNLLVQDNKFVLHLGPTRQVASKSEWLIVLRFAEFV